MSENLTPVDLELRWNADLEREFRALFAEVRSWPGVGDCSTPELFKHEQKKEAVRAFQFLRKLRFILDRARPAAIDCAVVQMIEDMKQAHDGAKAREVERYGGIR